MALVTRGRQTRVFGGDYWPGFVDAMATLLLVIIFLLSVFMLSQFYLADALTGRDTALERLRSEMAELANLLALERETSAQLRDELSLLSTSLEDAEAENSRLSGLLAEAEGGAGAVTALETALAEEKEISSAALAQVELLNQQLAALRRQIASLEQALEASEARDRESQAQIADLGRRLNAALAQKVQELAKYRSEFFGRLREAIGNRADIEIVGDRFVFQSDIFFESGSADIGAAGRQQLDKLASTLLDISSAIPEDLNWVLRVDGHSDARPIATADFASNWHLSAARAISVVEYLTSKGVPPKRLVAAGFGEYQPLDPGTSELALRRNRRIEFKLTER